MKSKKSKIIFCAVGATTLIASLYTFSTLNRLQPKIATTTSEEQPKPEIIAEVERYDAEWTACEKSFVHKSEIEDCLVNVVAKSFDVSKKSRDAWIAEDLPDIISKYQIFTRTYISPMTAAQEQRNAEVIAEKNQYHTDSLACKKSFADETANEVCHDIATRKLFDVQRKSRDAWIAKDLPERRSTPEESGSLTSEESGSLTPMEISTRQIEISSRHLERSLLDLEGVKFGNKVKDKLTKAKYAADPIPTSSPATTPTPVATSNDIDVEKGLIPVDSESTWAKTTTKKQDPFADLTLEPVEQAKKSK